LKIAYPGRDLQVAAAVRFLDGFGGLTTGPLATARTPQLPLFGKTTAQTSSAPGFVGTPQRNGFVYSTSGDSAVGRQPLPNFTHWLRLQNHGANVQRAGSRRHPAAKWVRLFNPSA
jgi:hypothetical protein